MIWTAKVVTGSGVGAEEIQAKSSLCRRVTAIGALDPKKQDCYVHALRSIRQPQALAACYKLVAPVGRPFKRFESFDANHLDKAEEVFGSLEKPAKRLLGYLEVLRIACFYIGFVENVVPGREAVLFPRPCLDEPPIPILGEAAKKFEVMRRWAVLVRVRRSVEYVVSRD